jgi:diaminohydroxyphosphoribosylaminopyrimidine deaminase/5-amino-6-(5-phosphoribosylamino)uracil reductase
MTINNKDIEYMSLAIAEAKKGYYSSLPNPCVGCVIVRDNIILGKGYHKKTGTPHAEINAIKDAQANGYSLEGTTFYVTLEPCAHQGLTPSCARTLAQLSIKRLVCAMTDPNPLVSGKGFDILREVGVEIDVGVLEQEAKSINRPFLFSIQQNRPFVYAKVGMSLDGKIALSNGVSKWITSEDSRKDVQTYRAYAQALITSADTVIADNPKMNLRKENLPADFCNTFSETLDIIESPIIIVIDAKNKLTGSEEIFCANKGSLIWVKGTEKKLECIQIEDCKNYKIFNMPYECTNEDNNSKHISLDLLLRELDKLRVRSVMVESGGALLKSFIDAKLLNEIIVYVAPKVLGTDGLNAFKLSNCLSMDEVLNMQLIDCKQIGNDVRLTYQVN